MAVLYTIISVCYYLIIAFVVFVAARNLIKTKNFRRQSLSVVNAIHPANHGESSRGCWYDRRNPMIVKIVSTALVGIASFTCGDRAYNHRNFREPVVIGPG